MNLSKEHVSQYKNSEESNEAFVADANMEEWIQTTTAADEEDNDRLSLVIQWYPSKKPLKIYQNTPNNPNKSNLRKIHISMSASDASLFSSLLLLAFPLI
jgi:hypothetical protein